MKKAVIHRDHIKVVQIPENDLKFGVLKALEGREIFIETGETDSPERMFVGEIFDRILEEEFSDMDFIPDTSKPMKQQLEELSKICENSSYVQITTH